MTQRYAEVEALIADEPTVGTDSPGAAGDMRRLCGAASRALSASGAGLTVMTADGLRGITAASGPDAEQLEELQFTLGEGPCVDAYEIRKPVLVPRLGEQAMIRWPVYAPAAHDHGVRAVFAFPLQIGAARLGVLDVFRTEPGMLSQVQVALALTFAEVAVAALINGQQRLDGAEHDRGWLDDPLGSRTELFQAQGMVMVQLRSGLAEALARMRAYAFAHDMRLADVASSVVARRIVFDRQDP